MGFNTSDWTIDYATKEIYNNNSATIDNQGIDTFIGETILWYQWLASTFINTSQMDDPWPINAITNTDFEFENGWTFRYPLQDYKYLKGATITDPITNIGSPNIDSRWSNVYFIGVLEAGSEIYMIQNDSIVTSYWPLETLDILVLVKNTGTWVTSPNNLTSANINGSTWFYLRQFGSTYDHSFVDLSNGGRTPIGVNNVLDLNNETSNTIVAEYSSNITISYTGPYSKDIGDGEGVQDYDISIDCGGLGVKEVYEYLKYITSFTYGTGTVNGDLGYEYRRADELTNYLDTKLAPFGTFAGGKFFGARGIWIENMITSDNTNYQLIDTTGTTRYPPVTYYYEFTGLIDNTEVRIYTSDLSTELFGIENTIGGVATYNYTSIEVDAVAMIHNVAYETIRLTIQLNRINSSVPVQQRFDRNYNNPI